MIRYFILPALLLTAAPAFAQMDHSTMDHAKMDHETMAHGDDHTHDDMTESPAATDATLTLADTPELTAALSAGGEPIVASVLGAVCDFCALAMNKTFGKRDEVAAVYVDLDAKTLNLVLKPGASLSDETLKKAVKKAGYKVSLIERGAALTE